MKHLMPNDPRHEISRSTVIKGLRTGLATCRFLYIASIGSAPSISLYGMTIRRNDKSAQR
jgi:hypothetical protein